MLIADILMRFKLTLQALKSRKIPLNYQYELSSWIYKLFSEINPEFASELHEKKLDQYKRNFKRRCCIYLFIYAIGYYLGL